MTIWIKNILKRSTLVYFRILLSYTSISKKDRLETFSLVIHWCNDSKIYCFNDYPWIENREKRKMWFLLFIVIIWTERYYFLLCCIYFCILSFWKMHEKQWIFFFVFKNKVMWLNKLRNNFFRDFFVSYVKWSSSMYEFNDKIFECMFLHLLEPH